MIKRIKGSLFAKVFILTVAVLLCVSFLVYGVLAWYMPQTYSNNLNAALDEQTSDFIYELEHIRMQDSGGLFDQFLQNTTISMVELYTADGVLVETAVNKVVHVEVKPRDHLAHDVGRLEGAHLVVDVGVGGEDAEVGEGLHFG